VRDALQFVFFVDHDPRRAFFFDTLVEAVPWLPATKTLSAVTAGSHAKLKLPSRPRRVFCQVMLSRIVANFPAFGRCVGVTSSTVVALRAARGTVKGR
jgi:hypothetical protein